MKTRTRGSHGVRALPDIPNFNANKSQPWAFACVLDSGFVDSINSAIFLYIFSFVLPIKNMTSCRNSSYDIVSSHVVSIFVSVNLFLCHFHVDFTGLSQFIF